MKSLTLAAAALAIAVIIAHYAGLHDLVRWGFRVPMGLVSCVAVLLVAAPLLLPLRFVIPAQIVFALFAMLSIWAASAGVQLYPAPEGTGGWYKPSSPTSLMCALLLITSQWICLCPDGCPSCHPWYARAFRWFSAIAVSAISVLTMESWLTLTTDEAALLRIGYVGFSFPTAVCYLLLALGSLRGDARR